MLLLHRNTRLAAIARVLQANRSRKLVPLTDNDDTDIILGVWEYPIAKIPQYADVSVLS